MSETTLYVFHDFKADSKIPFARLILDAQVDQRQLQVEEGSEEDIEIPPLEGLIGVDSEVLPQVSAALRSGKRHLIFYGPPGTGKTTLAEHVAGCLSDSYQLVTGSSDWSSQDLIGGYMPTSNGGLYFFPGMILSDFDNPIVVDELNRCDIDKVIGPMFTMLSGQPTTLPYLTDPADKTSDRVRILPKPKSNAAKGEFAPGPKWRILATLNTLDKASLYQLSYALSRRFAWIYVGIPSDLRSFLIEFCNTYYPKQTTGKEPFEHAPLADIWGTINKCRGIGPAPILDVISYCLEREADFSLFSEPNAQRAEQYREACSIFIFPLLDGILSEDAEQLTDALGKLLEAGGSDLQKRLREELMDLSV